MTKTNLYSTFLGGFLIATLCGMNVARADSLSLVMSGANQQSTDSITWASVGGDQTALNASGGVATTHGRTIQIALSGANSVLSKVCSASPCSWTGAGFPAGDTLLWTSDAGNGGTGPVRLTFPSNMVGAGAVLQANGPGPFTAKIEAFNGGSSLGSFTVPSNSQGAPVYIGVLDHTAANVTSVVFSLTSVSAGLTSDFGIDTVLLSGSTGTPTVHLSTGTLSFPARLIHTTSVAQTVTLSNSGTAALTFSSIVASGDFAQSNNCRSPLAAGGSCSISVTFDPTVAGARTGAITVTDNGPGSPHRVSLSGTGNKAKLSTNSLAFPATHVGSVSAFQTVTLTNLGVAPLSITSMSFGGTNPHSFEQHNSCGSSVAAGASCTISVAFAPGLPGALSAVLSIASNGGVSPENIALSGTGQ